MTSPESPIALIENELALVFSDAVRKLLLPEIMVPYTAPDGEPTPHERLEDYELWPILGRVAPDYPSIFGSGDDYTIAADPILRQPLQYLDTRDAIGLAFHGRLVAIGGAGVAANGMLRVRQLQGASKDSVDPVGARGRRGGFRWSDTLVEAWTEVGRQTEGVGGMEIRPGSENSWINKGDPKSKRRRITNMYDKTAQRRGFTRPNDQNNMWSRPFEPTT